jgi:L-fucose mutarotase
MLKGIDRALSAEMLMVLMSMGHGDEILVCDVNHPAASIAKHTTYGKLVDMAGCKIPRAIEAILTLMPLDTFVEAPIKRMEVVGDPSRIMPIHEQVGAAVAAVEGRPIGIEPLERFAFYEAAQKCFAVVRTSDPGPYGCFILRKGIVDA